MRATRHVLAVAALSGALVGVLAAPATANHDDNSWGERPDNANQQYDRHSLTSDGTMAANHGAFELDYHTQIYTSYGNNDIHAYDDYYGTNGWAGRETCTDINWWNGRCDHHQVRFNLTYMAGDSDSRWRHLGCHEFAHTGGVNERSHSQDTDDNSCMHLWSSTHLDQHDISTINGNV